MPRSKGQDGKVGAVRAELEAAMLDLVDWQEVAPLVRLRIEQAIRRTGLDPLLSPALDDLSRMERAVVAAKNNMDAAVRSLLE